MANNKLNIKNNISLTEYKKMHKNFSYKLLSFTEKEVNDFDKINKGAGKSLLKGKKWCKIDGTYYQLPKAAAFNWFRNLGVAGKSAVCLLSCGVVAGATATPFIVNSLNKAPKVTIKAGKGLADVKQTVDAETGSFIITVTPKIETEAINKESIKVAYRKAGVVEPVPLDEDEYDLKEDTIVEIPQEVQEEHKGEELVVQLETTVTDTPDAYETNVEVDPETGEEELVAEVDSDNYQEEEVCVPSKGKDKKTGKKKKIDKVKIKAKKTEKEDKLKKLVLSNDIKNVEPDDDSKREGKGAFQDRKKLEHARMPDRLTTFHANMFSGCEGLKEVKGGKYTKELGEMCFMNNYKLKEFIGKNVEKIGVGCFACMLPEEEVKKGTRSELEKIHLSDKLEDFPAGAFYENRNLRSVKGGKNAKEVGEECYKNCFSLREADVLMSKLMEKVGNDAFRNTSIEKILIGAKIDISSFGRNFVNSFKNDGMLSSVYVENEDFANLSPEDHDYHGALDNANKVLVKKGLTLKEQSGILSRFKKNESESKKDKDYDVYDAPTSGDKVHQLYNHYDEGEKVKGYRYTGKEVNMQVPQKQEMISNVTHVNSHGLRNNKHVEKVDLRVTDEEHGEKTSFFTSIGTDMENGHSFHGCEFLERILGLEKVNRICSYSFMGTRLSEFIMPSNVTPDTLGKDVFSEHKTCKMQLHLESNDRVKNVENDDSKMFEASSDIYTSNEEPYEKSHLNKLIKEKKVELKETIENVRHYVKKAK